MDEVRMAYKEATLDVIEELKHLDPTTKEYAEAAKALAKLYEEYNKAEAAEEELDLKREIEANSLAETKKHNRNTFLGVVAGIAANLLLGLGLTAFEQRGAIFNGAGRNFFTKPKQ